MKWNLSNFALEMQSKLNVKELSDVAVESSCFCLSVFVINSNLRINFL